MNIGHSSRLPYDKCAYEDQVRESTSPGSYRLDTNWSHNQNGCLSTMGPRGSDGVSTLVGHTVAPSQKLVDFESMLSNRNVKVSKAKHGRVNPVKLSGYKLKHHTLCNNYLDPQYTRLTYPAESYRGLPINRFYNLPNDPQEHIFYDFAVNTTLEAKDNWVPDVPTPLNTGTYPNPTTSSSGSTSCRYNCGS